MTATVRRGATLMALIGLLTACGAGRVVPVPVTALDAGVSVHMRDAGRPAPSETMDAGQPIELVLRTRPGMTSIWASSESDVWVAGPGNVVLHADQRQVWTNPAPFETSQVDWTELGGVGLNVYALGHSSHGTFMLDPTTGAVSMVAGPELKNPVFVAVQWNIVYVGGAVQTPAGLAGYLMQTHNSGTTWRREALPTSATPVIGGHRITAELLLPDDLPPMVLHADGRASFFTSTTELGPSQWWSSGGLSRGKLLGPSFAWVEGNDFIAWLATDQGLAEWRGTALALPMADEALKDFVPTFIEGVDARALWGVSPGGEAAFFDGATWRRQHIPVTGRIVSVHASSSEVLFALTDQGEIFRVRRPE